MTERQDVKKPTPPPDPEVMESALISFAGSVTPGKNSPDPEVMKLALVAHENMEKESILDSKRRRL